MPQGLPVTMIMLVVMFAAMYFLTIRPQKKRQEELQKLRDALKVGDKIVTIGGMRGKVVAITDDSFEIETGKDGSRVEYLRSALSYVVTPAPGYVADNESEKAEEADSEKSN